MQFFFGSDEKGGIAVCILEPEASSREGRGGGVQIVNETKRLESNTERPGRIGEGGEGRVSEGGGRKEVQMGCR